MRRAWSAVLVTLALGSGCGGGSPADPAPAAQWWAAVAPFGGSPTRGATAFAVGGSAYVVSGLVEPGGLVAQTWRYDTAGNRWTRVADFPGTPRLDATAFAVGGKGYVALGSDNQHLLADLWEYDPAGDRWAGKRTFPGGARLLAAAFVVEGTAYVVGGATGAGPARDVWAYDAGSDTWTREADFAGAARSAATAFAIGSHGYVGLGNTGAAAPFSFVADFWEYDPPTDRWTRKADFPGAPRGYGLGLGLAGRGFVTQGLLAVTSSSSLALTNDLWEYAPATDTWTGRAALPGPGRAMAVAFVVGASGYVALGNNADVVNLRDLWRLTPQ